LNIFLFYFLKQTSRLSKSLGEKFGSFFFFGKTKRQLFWVDIPPCGYTNILFILLLLLLNIYKSFSRFGSSIKMLSGGDGGGSFFSGFFRSRGGYIIVFGGLIRVGN